MDSGPLFEKDPVRQRMARSQLNVVLQPRELLAYREVIRSNVINLLRDLLREPDNFVAHIRR